MTADPIPYREPVFVDGGGGTRIATYEFGNQNGPAALLIHGYNQCHLCWHRQVSGPLAERYRLIAFDLRGHGRSDKPLEADAYKDQSIWAADVAAVIKALEIDRPVLVGWSYGGHVINAYLETMGTAALSGVVYVGAITVAGNEKAGPLYLDEQRAVAAAMLDDNIYAANDATLAFIGRCFEEPPGEDETRRIIAYNMLVPVAVRQALRSRTIDADAVLAAIDVPTLVIHGTKDRVVLVESGRRIAALVPGSTLTLYEGIGHSPFAEAPERFDADLDAFLQSLTR
ncbi:MAG: alpha/beta hydrolase [Pseudomonadota bacterium]